MSDVDTYTIDDLVRRGPLSRTSIFKAIKQGHLRVKKFGVRTLVLPEQWAEFLRNLPDKDPTQPGPPKGRPVKESATV